MKLILPASRGKAFTPGFHNALLNGMDDVEIGPDVRIPGLPGGLHHAIVVEYGGKRICIHCGDYTSEIAQKATGNADLVLCVQYNESLKDLEVPVVPFVMFASDQVNMYGKMDKLREIVQKQPPKYELGFSGRLWRCRKKWEQYAHDKDWFYWENTPGQATQFGTWEEYAAKLGTWRRCLILGGKGTRGAASHNRREPECAAMGLPMVLNYKPHYYEPFVGGIHYGYAKTPERLQSLNDKHTARLGLSTDEKERVQGAREYWERNQSPAGICRLFKQICEENL